MGCQAVSRHWRIILLLLTPLVFAIIPLVNPTKAMRCGYVILVMSVYWMTEALPLAVTALIPVFAFPMLGVLSTDNVCTVYMKEVNMMILGGFSMAIAVECSDLHKRIALAIILRIGQSPSMLMLSFMVMTMLLSMFISNVASTAMMLPLVDAILAEICVLHQQDSENVDLDPGIAPFHGQIELVPITYFEQTAVSEVKHGAPPDEVTSAKKDTDNQKCSTAVPSNEDCHALREMCFLATAYAANLGGTGFLTGTPPNLVMKGVLASEPTGLNFLTWLLFNVPGMLICVLLCSLWLQILFLGMCREKKVIKDLSAERRAAVKHLVESRYEELGPITLQQVEVLILFLLLLLLWLFRQPEFIPGWAEWYRDAFGVKVGDASPAMLIVLLLFVLPARLKSDGDTGHRNSCLTWKVIQEKVPWNVLLLLGGSFALATGAKASGLSKKIGEQLYLLRSVDKMWVALGVSFLTAMLTEMVSNIAVVSIVLPVMNELALKMNVSPLYLMLPATVCSSYAFMLPAATPSNAIAFSAAGMKISDMMRAGIVLNIICVLVINIMINTLGYAISELDTMPAWTNSSITSNTV